MDKNRRQVLLDKDLLPDFLGSKEAVAGALAWLDKFYGRVDMRGRLMLDVLPEPGVAKGDFVVLAAPRYFGKTSYLVNVALGAARKGLNVGVFLPETTIDNFTHRLITTAAGEAYQAKIVSGRPQWCIKSDKINAAAKDVAAQPFYFSSQVHFTPDAFEIAVGDLNNCLKRKGQRLDMIILDSLNYLFSCSQTLPPDIGAAGRLVNLSKYKELAKDEDVCLVASFRLPKEFAQDVWLADMRLAGLDERYIDLLLYLDRPRVDGYAGKAAGISVIHSGIYQHPRNLTFDNRSGLFRTQRVEDLRL